ncbi:hypothetical protein FJY63_04070 [Candidatus Sumerlaeota bacterium]|nr:hypothetical protein [Candidatus Sumerlaeota bacterium]
MRRCLLIFIALTTSVAIVSCSTLKTDMHVPYASMRGELENEYGSGARPGLSSIVVSSELLPLLPEGVAVNVIGFDLATESNTGVGMLALTGNTNGLDDQNPLVIPDSSLARQWESQMSQAMSQKYLSKVEDMARDMGNWPRNLAKSAAANRTIHYTGVIYKDLTATWNMAGNLCRAERGLGPTNIVLERGEAGRALFGASAGSQLLILKGIDTGLKFVNLNATTLQSLNPPIYLREHTSEGWIGSGNEQFGTSRIAWTETLETKNPITRDRTLLIQNPNGYYRGTLFNVTPPAHGFESFLMHNRPLGSYFEPGTTVETITRTGHYTIHETSGNWAGLTSDMVIMDPRTLQIVNDWSAGNAQALNTFSRWMSQQNAQGMANFGRLFNNPAPLTSYGLYQSLPTLTFPTYSIPQTLTPFSATNTWKTTLPQTSANSDTRRR